MEQVKDIEKIKMLEKYEIVLCDIKGVGKSFGSEYEGAYLIREFKRHYPFKYCIGYSGTQFDPKFSEYTDHCDKFANKDSSIEDWQGYLDEAITKIVDPVEKWHTIRMHLVVNRVETEWISIFEDAYVRSINKRSPGLLAPLNSEQYPKVVRDLAVNLMASALWGLIAA